MDMKARLETLENELSSFELDPLDYIENFENMLDEVYPTYTICGMEYQPSQILKSISETDYRYILLDYLENVPIEDDDRYKAIQDEIDEIKEQLN